MSVVLIADKLRASLLQAAIQGKLTKQLPEEDGDARDLLKEIEAEKAQLVEEKVLRKEKPLPPITEDEIPFEIPENWVWQKLSTISYTIASKSYQILARDIIDQGLYPVVSQSQNYIDGYANNKDKVFTNVPIIIFGDHTKVIKLVDFPFIVGADGTKLIKPLIINIRYLEVVLQYHRINMHDRGYSRHFQFIKDSLVPIPPLAEQERIVEAIEIALAKIDKLKTDEDKLYDIQKAFPNKLRASLLQSAIQGQLTEQLPEDGDARDLLKEIEAEKARLIEEKIIKKEKPLPPITEEEIPFEIPENWAWVRLGDLSIFINGDRSANYPTEKDFVPTGIPFFGAKDMIRNQLGYNPNLRFISEEKFKSLRSGKLQHLDFVCLLRGSIGKYAFFPKNEKFDTGFINAQMVIIRALHIEMVHYFESLFKSYYFESFIKEASSGTAVKQLAAETLRALMIPLPPLAEQERIVKKLDEILGKVDGLKKITQ